MTDDQFFQRLRQDASRLQLELDHAAVGRIAARVRARMEAPPTVAQMLAGWLRPLAALVAIVTLAAALSLSWIESTRDPTTADQFAANTTEVSVGGVSFAGE